MDIAVFPKQDQLLLILKLLGGLDETKMYLATNSDIVYIWNGSQWILDSNSTLQKELGYPRTVINPITNKKFQIEENSVKLL